MVFNLAVTDLKMHFSVLLYPIVSKILSQKTRPKAFSLTVEFRKRLFNG